MALPPLVMTYEWAMAVISATPPPSRSFAFHAPRGAATTRRRATGDMPALPIPAEQCVAVHGEVAYPDAGGVMDRVDHRGRRPDDADLPGAARSHRAGVLVGVVVQPDGVHVGNVCVTGEVVAREVLGDDVAE